MESQKPVLTILGIKEQGPGSQSLAERLPESQRQTQVTWASREHCVPPKEVDDKVENSRRKPVLRIIIRA